MLCVAMKDGIYFLWKGVGTSWHRRGPVLARKMIMAMATDTDRRTAPRQHLQGGCFSLVRLWPILGGHNIEPAL